MTPKRNTKAGGEGDFGPKVTPTSGWTGYQRKTAKGYDMFEVSSALQKSIRRGDEEQAMYWAVELYISNLHNYLWKRLRIIASEDIGLAMPAAPVIIRALYENFNDLLSKEDAKHKPERLFLTQAVLMLCRAPKSRYVDWTLMYHWRGHADTDLEIPDYAFDKHNMKGKRMGRGWEHFFDVGSALENHVPVEGEKEMKEKARKLVFGLPDDDEEAEQIPLI